MFSPCPSAWSRCYVVLARASWYRRVLFLQLRYCCDQSPASCSSWCCSLVTWVFCHFSKVLPWLGQLAVVLPQQIRLYTYLMTNTAFPGKKLAQSCLQVAKHILHYGCPILAYCPHLSFCQAYVVPWNVWQCAGTIFGRKAGCWVCDQF